jgi:cytochrome b6-f complex iron-sulfur subunit
MSSKESTMSDTMEPGSAPQSRTREQGQDGGAALDRRQFLRQTACTAGGLVLGLTAVGAVAKKGLAEEKDDTAKEKPEEKDDVLVLELSEHKKLSKAGGFEVVKLDNERIIVVNTGKDNFVACSAVCTHRGCEVAYEHGARQFACPCHNARYELDGKVVRGPAKKPLHSYPAEATESAVKIKLDSPA